MRAAHDHGLEPGHAAELGRLLDDRDEGLERKAVLAARRIPVLVGARRDGPEALLAVEGGAALSVGPPDEEHLLDQSLRSAGAVYQ